MSDPSNLPSRLSELLEQRAPSYEESRDRADTFGLAAANGYTAGYHRAVMELRALETEEVGPLAS
jgi:hypothetical protein